MRRITWMLAIVMSVAILVAGCGKKDATDVVHDLDQVMSKLESYAGIGTMTLHSGTQPLQYRVEVWYQDPTYYRIELTNEKKDIKQIVLRNEEGVFVLTPSLKKIFRFQSEWPENQGQVYLYQTLVRSILSDEGRQFTEDGDSYVFDVAADYQTDSLVRQKIWLHKSDYTPKQVQVTDSEAQVVVEMKFNQFEFGKKFDKDSFDMQRNMTGMNHAMIPNGELDENGQLPSQETLAPTDGAEGTDAAEQQHDSANVEEDMGPFGLIEPSYLPEGVAKLDEKELPNNGDHPVMMRYTGTYSFTLIESRPKDMEVGLQVGGSKAVDLGFTYGQMTGEEQKTLTWTYEGVKYRMLSGDLPEQEMVKIAQSLVDQPGK
ncbi:DUF4367 domain-containing protein [Paenibacillus thiaminolyticus]|uniref:DUF4367 domain-containing protein n=1 Tax=Paenibacillus thiaminolyticus TaxID=49283 RepID=A0AAP9J0S8_PANTH|nr:DUF4367 domain-containing protein [Paenibacillus thiaminolyticus]MCY9533656.1 DUF4367 domain-containing protein [Paenibacillus thiaminolyticus]MCY9600878.1 DUF4367 domain-containing protein [Paenibacillus thiaminolyticus]MCY9607707.1 DUF4367 domain-containing protein [Paenibacillus thiaminolyticus]MCY9611506.1 DUF4367 domain-containing protein [Paenibacillus thiaminolyticus]MCY9617223.1 DUF4367 domain-containing protein [Paenibacillus thiaminolyticus]